MQNVTLRPFSKRSKPFIRPLFLDTIVEKNEGAQQEDQWSIWSHIYSVFMTVHYNVVKMVRQNEISRNYKDNRWFISFPCSSFWTSFEEKVWKLFCFDQKSWILLRTVKSELRADWGDHCTLRHDLLLENLSKTLILLHIISLLLYGEILETK